MSDNQDYEEYEDYEDDQDRLEDIYGEDDEDADIDYGDGGGDEEEDGEEQDLEQQDIQIREDKLNMEKGILERAGPRFQQLLGGIALDRSNRQDNIYRKFERMGISDEDKFKYMMYFQLIRYNEILKISSDEELDEITDFRNISNIIHKNPTCYLLASYIILHARSIDKKRFDRVIDEIVPELQGITKFDILRYCRFLLATKYQQRL